LAATELSVMSDKEAAKQALAKAETAYDTLTRFLAMVDGGPQKQAIQEKLN